MDLELRGRVALITGSSEGIGKGTAQRLAEAGASVVMCARRPDVLEAAAEEIREQTGAQILAVPMDIRDPEQVTRLVGSAVAEFGRLDILVNNAGTAVAKPFEQVTDQDWDDDLGLKLYGAIRTIRAALPSLRASDQAAIVNVLNTGAKAPRARSTPTTVSRAAGMALTKVLSLEFAPENITVNAVLIGTIKSGQHETSAARLGITPEQFYEDRVKSVGIPLGRVGETLEAADLITFLVSARARYITGTAVNMDGGMTPIV